MDKNMKLEEVIIEYMLSYKINDGDYQSLRMNLKEDLSLLEGYFQTVSDKQTSILKEIKALKLNLVNVSERSGVTRSTIYNNPEVLKIYIESRIKEINERDIFSHLKLENKEKEVQLLNEHVQNLRINAVRAQALTDVIDELKQEVNDLNKIQQANVQRIQQLEKEKRDLLIMLKEYEKGKIVSINQ